MIDVLMSRFARMRANDERGFALIFVLFVTTVVMIGTATTLSVVTGNITPSRQNQDTAAALAAAQAGVQRYLATLDANCPVSSMAQCTLLKQPSTSTINGVTGTEGYTVTVVNPGSANDAGYLSTANGGTVYVTSTGTSPVAANGTPASGAVTRTITAALSGAPNPLDLAYFSDYETVGSTFLNSYFGARRITLLNPAVLNALGISAASATVTWNGASWSSPSGLGDDICDKLWYDAPSNVNDGDSNPYGRYTLKTSRSALPPGTDYAENGTLQPLGGASAAVTRYAPCETTFTGGDGTGGENFNGPVYSQDALFLSNGTTGNAGPSFTVPAKQPLPAASTGWTTFNTPAAPVGNGAYRSFPSVGGMTANQQAGVVSSPYGRLSLPSTLGISGGTCTFTGPTTISLSGSNALVTSPLTSSPGSSCPATVSAGLWTVPVTTTTIYVANASTSLTTNALNSLLGLLNPDITYYSPSAGDAYVSGTLTSGKLSIATEDDVVVTGNILAGHSTAGDGKQPSITDAAGEPAWSPGSAAIDLVATHDVRVYHPVACAAGVASYGPNGASTPSASNPNGWCPNDITGLYQTTNANLVVDSSGSLRSTHPSKQYVNVSGVTEPSEIDAAIFALNGSFYADNFDRGTGLGPLTVSGGVYENHHGPLGEQWETPTGATARAYSGFKLQITYLNYSNAGLGYVPELSGGNALEPWQVVDVTSGGTTP